MLYLVYLIRVNMYRVYSFSC